MKARRPSKNRKAQGADVAPLLIALQKAYPDAFCALNYKTPYQLLVATILSAQCTDVRVNLVTPALFKRFPDAKTMARASLEEIADLIKSTGFFRSKAKSLLEMSRALVENHNGEVPASLKELTQLRGVGRKTANVVLGEVFGIQEGVVVDTHVGRLSRRLGLTRSQSPEHIEKDLMKSIPRQHWTQFSHWLISHGRAVCKARRPACGQCSLFALCPTGKVELPHP